MAIKYFCNLQCMLNLVRVYEGLENHLEISLVFYPSHDDGHLMLAESHLVIDHNLLISPPVNLQ